MWLANEKLKRLASTDTLTGLLNRRAGQDMLEQEFASVKRGKQTISLMMIDLDHFKKINDTHGHDAGDAVLKEIATRMKGGLRKYDSVIRWGGEEFMIICRHTKPEDATVIAHQVLQLVSSKPVFVNKNLTLDVTASIGAACSPKSGDTEPHRLIAKADKALYQAKESGRNCAKVWSFDVAPVAENGQQ